MTNTMGGAHLCMPQSIFQQMNQQSSQQQVGPWTQTPQVPPMTIPWRIPCSQQQELIRFTGETSSGPILHQKRKLGTLDHLDMSQRKQFITEEKMAAHFKDLHISSSHKTESSMSSTVHKQSDMDIEGANSINSEQTNDVHPRLILSEELKRLQQEPILPSSFLSKLERPSMALVLWEPPSKHLRILPTRDTPTPIPSTSNDTNNNNNNNNNSNSNNNNNDATPDLNNVSPPSMFEPMEL